MRKFLLAMALMPLMALSDTEVVDGITWTYTINDGKAQVGSGSSYPPAVSSSTSGAITIPSRLGGCPVTSIGYYAFGNCRGLLSVTIPAGVTSIGTEAFYGCSGLTSVTIPAGVLSIGNRAFCGCSGLTSVMIPEGVTSIEYYAFSGCSGLITVMIPSSVTSIGNYAFYHCSGLTSVTMPEGVMGIGDYVFSGCSGLATVMIPSSVTSIGNYAFYQCSKLTSVAIPEGVTNIGCYAFSGCSGLTTVTIPSSVTSIGDYAFYYCSKLTSVTIPEGAMSIGDYAFDGCSGLADEDGFIVVKNVLYDYCGKATSVAIPSAVTSIGNKAFYGRGELMSVTIPAGVTSIGTEAFYNCRSLTSMTIPSSVKNIGSSAFLYCDGLKEVRISDLAAWCGTVFVDASANPLWHAHQLYLNDVEVADLTLPDGMTNVNSYAFCGCSGLTSVTIPEGVTSIGNYAFYHCSGLTSVTIPEGVTSIGNYAFYHCSGLISVTIPSSVTSIGDYAFSWCSGLTSMSVPESVAKIVSSVFSGCTALTSLQIPSCVEEVSKVFPVQNVTNIVLSDAFTNISSNLLRQCSRLADFKVGLSIKQIEKGAFDDTEMYLNAEDGLVYVDGCLVAIKGMFPKTLLIPETTRLMPTNLFGGIEFCNETGKIEPTLANIAGRSYELALGCFYVSQEQVDSVRHKIFNEMVGATTNVSLVGFDGGDWGRFSWDVPRYEYGTVPGWSYLAYENRIDTPVIPVNALRSPVVNDDSEHSFAVEVQGAGLFKFRWGVAVSSTRSTQDLVVGQVYPVEGVADNPKNPEWYGRLDLKKGLLKCYVDGEYWTSADPQSERSELISIPLETEGKHEIQFVYSFTPGISWQSVQYADDPFGYVGGVSWMAFDEEDAGENVGTVSLITSQFQAQEYGDWYLYGEYGIDNGFQPEVFVFTEDGFPLDSYSYDVDVDGDIYAPGDVTLTVSGRDALVGVVSEAYNIAHAGWSGGEYEWYAQYDIYYFDGERECSGGTDFTYSGLPVRFSVANNYSMGGSDYCNYVVYRYDDYESYYQDGYSWYRTPYAYGDMGSDVEFSDAGIYVIEIAGYSQEWSDGNAFGGWWSKETRLDTEVVITINPLEIDNEDGVVATRKLTYTGDELVQEVRFDAFAGEFTCECEGNVVTDAGTYRMTVYGTGSFGGVKEIEFTVAPKSITNATVVVDSSNAKYYAGDACLPSVVVTDEDRKCELVEGTDYVLEYANNTQPGLATVTVVGTNNYCDVIVRQWTILAREDAEILGAWSQPQTFEYDGKVHGVDYSAHLDVMAWPLNVVTQGTIRAVNVGEYAATARAETVGVPETDSVYYRCAAVTNECTWTITPKPVTKLQIDYVSTAMIANGRQQKPQIVVRDVERGVVLTSADYALVYENNVEPGMGIARITGKGNYGGETTIEFPIVAGVSPAEGLNMDGDTFEIVGETDWVADNVVTHDRYASMRSGAIGDNEESTLAAVVHGAGTVSFWWKVSSQHFDSVLELDRLEFYVDGVRQKWVNGDVDWTKLSFKVNGAGPHELKWVYAKDGSVSERQDCGWVDEVSWEKEWLIGDWLNDVDREFATSDVKWSPDASVSSDGVGSMRNGVCQQGQRSVLSTVVENVGTLTFKWKCSCVAYGEYVTDKLALLVDGVPAKDAVGKDIFINGETGWCDVSYRITGAGRHEVQWVFEKVSDASMGQNCGWVDAVRWDNEPGTLTDEDLVVEAFDGVYDGQGHGAAVSVKGVQDAAVKYGMSRETIGDATSPTFVNCGEYEVWFAVNVPEFNEYVGKTVVRVSPRSIETGEVTLGVSLVYTGSVLTQAVASVVVGGLNATFEVSDNEACAAGAYQLTVAGTGNFCGELSVPFTVAKSQAPSGDVTVEGYSPEACAVEFTYDGKAHQPNVVAGYDGTAVVRFALTEDGPYVDELNVSNVVERMDVWYEIVSANYERLVGQTQMTIRPQSIAGAEVVLGEQVSDAEGHVVQLVDSVIVNGLSVTFVVSNNVAEAEGDFELSVYGVGNFEGEAKCPYSVGGIVLPPVLTPGDGTIFTESLIVRFSAQTPDSKWYYTLDGSMPTTNSLKAARVNLHGKTTIRAIAVLDGKLRSAVVESHYALGACENPKISLDGQDGCEFHFPEQLVVIDRNGEEGVVRYTLDGSEPTADSPAYEGPFAISVSTTVKAKTFSDSWFDSETVMANMRLETLPVPSPAIDAVSEYCGTKTTVSLSCTLSGAVIRYTLDGSEPTATSDLYEQPFEIGGEVGSAIRVRARAFCEHYADSSVVEAVVTRVWGVGDTLGVPDMTFETDGWVVDTDETFAGRESMRSGPTDDGETNTLETVVHGGGIVAFSWRTSCEDSFGDFIWDRAEFWVDDDCIAKVEGESGWTHISHAIQHGDADHRLRWLYVKDPDKGTAEGKDCAWLAALTWESETTKVPPPSIADDPEATVTGDAESGFVVKPSEGKTAVEVTIPGGIDAGLVTVEVSTKVASVKPNGAKVKIVSGGADITEFLNVPTADGSGVVDLTKATVKEEIVKEALDPAKGAEIKLDAANPTLTTAPTRAGLLYQLREGKTLGGMKDGDSKVGDGLPWSPEITVKGGNSAFYSIGIGKGE